MIDLSLNVAKKTFKNIKKFSWCGNYNAGRPNWNKGY